MRVRAGTRVVREREIDVVLSTSPPNSVHVIGAAIARRTGVPFVADFRDSWLANPHRRYDRRSVRAKRAVEERIARAALRRVAAVSAVTPSIAEEAAALAPAGTPRARRRQRLRLRRVRRARRTPAASACASSTRARSSASARRGRS